MRITWIARLLFTTASCLISRLAVAQPTAIAPLAPVVVQPVSSIPDLARALQTSLPDAHRSSAVLATPTYSARQAWLQPVYLLNSRVIVNELAVVRPEDIEQVAIYKEPKLPTPRQWWSLTEHGIVAIELKLGAKLKLKTESLAAIRRQLKLTGAVNFQLGGLPMEDTSLRIATADIAGFEVSRSDSETVVNIRLLPPTPAPPLPPGSIRIRGVAGR